MDWAAVATIISSLLGSGGVVMFFLDRRQKREEKAEAVRQKIEDARRKKEEEQQQHILDGIKLGLENDAVIFKALREHKINGESELQEQKMNEFFRKQFTK